MSRLLVLNDADPAIFCPTTASIPGLHHAGITHPKHESSHFSIFARTSPYALGTDSARLVEGSRVHAPADLWTPYAAEEEISSGRRRRCPTPREVLFCMWDRRWFWAKFHFQIVWWRVQQRQWRRAM